MSAVGRVSGLAGVLVVFCLGLASLSASAAERKGRAVTLGAAHIVPYSKEGDPAGSNGDEKTLKTRPLVVDGRVTEWTTGEAHEVTDRSFVVRRALRVNDALPGEKTDKGGHWVWQRGPWLLVDRASGHVTPLKLPEYDASASDVTWFRDYAAYCGVSASGKSLYALVAQVAVRKPVVRKKLGAYDAQHPPWPVCAEAVWQREPLRVTFQPTGKGAESFDLTGNSAVLVEGGDEPDVPADAPQAAGPATRPTAPPQP
uniref:Uncharacterized protein n=1 Tax=mine drainage metagenome TaxID=410659 RepID=E6PYP3_9ZZZZ